MALLLYRPPGSSAGSGGFGVAGSFLNERAWKIHTLHLNYDALGSNGGHLAK